MTIATDASAGRILIPNYDSNRMNVKRVVLKPWTSQTRKIIRARNETNARVGVRRDTRSKLFIRASPPLNSDYISREKVSCVSLMFTSK